MFNRRKLRRALAPTADLGGSIVAATLGLALLIGGLTLSFRTVATPVLAWVKATWFTFVHSFGVTSAEYANHLLGGALLILGFVLTYVGIRSIMARLFRTLSPGAAGSVGALYVRKQQLAQGPKIVCLGGGTGLSTLLRGLKNYSSNITAIVTVTDDGGSSGRLSEELGIIPPGDLRNCLVALADAEKLMTDLFQYRFKGKRGSLSGHSLGNLLIAGLIEQCGGDFERALNMASEVLAIRGRVMPSTLERVRLKALLEDGKEVFGETNIAASGGRIRRIFMEPNNAHAFPDAIEAIREAELVVMGPGSVYSSVIPNLLVPGIPEAIRDSRATKAYICNVMTQPGESDSFTAAEHVLAIEANVSHRLFDFVLVNNQLPSSNTLEKYRDKDQYPVEADVDRIRSMGFGIVRGEFMSESDYVRHDPSRMAEALIKLLNR
ncbi:MAG: YvcK family protein [Fimbriimonadaceae bacterium]|nr:YvcK family protein [Fimbriimonadaceae bacterium]